MENRSIMGIGCRGCPPILVMFLAKLQYKEEEEEDL